MVGLKTLKWPKVSGLSRAEMLKWPKVLARTGATEAAQEQEFAKKHPDWIGISPRCVVPKGDSKFQRTADVYATRPCHFSAGKFIALFAVSLLTGRQSV